MRMVDLIIDKREGKAHTREEINYIIREYTAGNIPDYQMSAWLMAVCWRGMTEREVSELTSAMMHSGDVVDLSDLPGVKVDKHSTGGVGDTTTLVIAPLVAACGGTVAKAGWGSGYGYVVYINHPDGRQTRYGHLSKVLVKPGQSVSQGQKIALSGNTGRSTGPHLHFEILIGGSQVDPFKYMN